MFVNRGYCDGKSFKSICGQGEIMFLRGNRGHVTANRITVHCRGEHILHWMWRKRLKQH